MDEAERSHCNATQKTDVFQTPNSYNSCLQAPSRFKKLQQTPLHSNSAAKSNSIPYLQLPVRSRNNLTSSSLSDATLDNMLLRPRRTEEMLQSPLHKELRPTVQRSQEHTPNLRLMPMRTKNILQSPLQRSCASTPRPKTVKHQQDDEAPLSASLLDLLLKNINSEPRRIKEMLRSPLHKNTHWANPSPREDTIEAVRRKLHLKDGVIEEAEERLLSHLKRFSAMQTISKRDIQQMSLKNFLKIINHLLPFAGVRIKTLDKSNYIEQTIFALQQLNYPHKVNKSWLLMPSASLNHILLLLEFLLDFAPTERDDFEKLPELTLTDDAIEIGDLKDTITLDQDLQYKQDKSDLIEQQIEFFMMEIKTVKCQLTKCHDELSALDQQSSKQVKAMGQVCIELWRKNSELNQLKNRVTVSKDNNISYDQILDERNVRYNELRAHSRHLQELAERIRTQGIMLKRSRKNFLQNIESFNVIMRDLYYSPMLGNLCKNSFELPLSPSIAEIKDRRHKLKRLRIFLELKCNKRAEGSRRALMQVATKNRYSM